MTHTETRYPCTEGAWRHDPQTGAIVACPPLREHANHMILTPGTTWIRIADLIAAKRAEETHANGQLMAAASQMFDALHYALPLFHAYAHSHDFDGDAMHENCVLNAVEMMASALAAVLGDAAVAYAFLTLDNGAVEPFESNDASDEALHAAPDEALLF